MGGFRHAIVLAERDDEVGLCLRQHLPIVGVDRWPTDLCRAPSRDGGVRVMEADELDVRHRGEDAQVGGVPQRVPVADLDGGDAHQLTRSKRPVTTAQLLAFAQREQTQERDRRREATYVEPPRGPGQGGSPPLSPRNARGRSALPAPPASARAPRRAPRPIHLAAAPPPCAWPALPR